MHQTSSAPARPLCCILTRKRCVPKTCFLCTRTVPSPADFLAPDPFSGSGGLSVQGGNPAVKGGRWECVGGGMQPGVYRTRSGGRRLRPFCRPVSGGLRGTLRGLFDELFRGLLCGRFSGRQNLAAADGHPAEASGTTGDVRAGFPVFSGLSQKNIAVFEKRNDKRLEICYTIYDCGLSAASCGGLTFFDLGEGTEEMKQENC